MQHIHWKEETNQSADFIFGSPVGFSNSPWIIWNKIPQMATFPPTGAWQGPLWLGMEASGVTLIHHATPVPASKSRPASESAPTYGEQLECSDASPSYTVEWHGVTAIYRQSGTADVA